MGNVVLIKTLKSTGAEFEMSFPADQVEQILKDTRFRIKPGGGPKPVPVEDEPVEDGETNLEPTHEHKQGRKNRR